RRNVSGVTHRRFQTLISKQRKNSRAAHIAAQPEAKVRDATAWRLGLLIQSRTAREKRVRVREPQLSVVRVQCGASIGWDAAPAISGGCGIQDTVVSFAHQSSKCQPVDTGADRTAKCCLNRRGQVPPFHANTLILL